MPILFSCSVSLCDKSCVLEVVSSESADWNCVGEKKKSHLDIACLLLLQYHCCRKQLESQRMVIEQRSCGCFFFFCTVIKPLRFVDISFSFRALGNPSRKKCPLKSPRTGHKGWYVQIYSIYTSPGQRPVSLGICHPTQISSPIPWG